MSSTGGGCWFPLERIAAVLTQEFTCEVFQVACFFVLDTSVCKGDYNNIKKQSRKKVEYQQRQVQLQLLLQLCGCAGTPNYTLVHAAFPPTKGQSYVHRYGVSGT